MCREHSICTLNTEYMYLVCRKDYEYIKCKTRNTSSLYVHTVRVACCLYSIGVETLHGHKVRGRRELLRPHLFLSHLCEVLISRGLQVSASGRCIQDSKVSFPVEGRQARRKRCWIMSDPCHTGDFDWIFSGYS